MKKVNAEKQMFLGREWKCQARGRKTYSTVYLLYYLKFYCVFVCMCEYHLLKTVLKNNLVLEVNHQRRGGILKWEGEENEKKKMCGNEGNNWK